MRNKHLVITVLLIGIVDFIGNRLFDTCRFEFWYKPTYFSLIIANFLIGYKYWKTREHIWLKVFWSFIYSFITIYFLASWALEFVGYSKNYFIYKTYIHIGLTPLTFGFIYLIEFTVNNSENPKKS